ncbi:MAG TPA: response regulator transcription factor [Actinomycetes bacterium]|nr:response regulator transcription factor [Actinomycetes bacterium]
MTRVTRTRIVRLTPPGHRRRTGMLEPGGVPDVEGVSVGEDGEDGEHGVLVRVLVVDDQAPFRRAMRSVVEETDGFEVVGEVDSGEASLEAAAALAPDLVLMDVHLPGIDGLEATRRLAALPVPPVVLLLSTYDDDAGEGFVAESGAAGYVTKSAFGPDRLESAWSSASSAGAP